MSMVGSVPSSYSVVARDLGTGNCVEWSREETSKATIVAWITGLLALTIIGIPFAIIFFYGWAILYGLRLTGKMAARKQEAVARVRGIATQLVKDPIYLDVFEDGLQSETQMPSPGFLAVTTGSTIHCLTTEGVYGELPWERVSSWSWAIEGYDTYHSSSLSQSMNAKLLTHEAQTAASKSSGFTIHTSDPDYPTWTIQTLDQKLCERWVVILNNIRDQHQRTISKDRN